MQLHSSVTLCQAWMLHFGSIFCCICVPCCVSLKVCNPVGWWDSGQGRVTQMSWTTSWQVESSSTGPLQTWMTQLEAPHPRLETFASRDQNASGIVGPLHEKVTAHLAMSCDASREFAMGCLKKLTSTTYNHPTWLIQL